MAKSLLDRVREDHIASRRNRNVVLSNLLGTIISECDTIAKSGKAARELTDDEVLAIIQKTRKKMLETIVIIAEIPERAEQKTKLLQEREYLEVYLPQMLTNEELAAIVIQREILNENLGQIMGYLKKNYAGRYDAKEAHAYIKEMICSEHT